MFVSVSLCWHVLSTPCLIWQPAKPEQPRWTAGGVIYGLVIGISLLSCSILIANVSLRGYVWESRRDRNMISQSNVKYKSHQKKSPHDWLLGGQKCESQKRLVDRSLLPSLLIMTTLTVSLYICFKTEVSNKTGPLGGSVRPTIMYSWVANDYCYNIILSLLLTHMLRSKKIFKIINIFLHLQYSVQNYISLAFCCFHCSLQCSILACMLERLSLHMLTW